MVVASSRRAYYFLVVAALALAVAPAALATDYVVGDEKGWTLDFDYQEWARGKTFYVGDRLIFKYAADKHNVFKVSGPQFQACSASGVGDPLSSGNDVIPLATPGRKWYICGVNGHCQNGMKLVITVQPQLGSPAPSPSSPGTNSAPAATAILSGNPFGWLIAAASSMFVIIMA